MSTNTGPVVALLDDATSYARDGVGSLADIQPGLLVGVTGHPTADGLQAVEFHIFPARLTSVPQGQTPMSGANAGNVVTNASIESLTTGVVTLRLADRSVSILTTPATEIRRPVPASAAEVQEGTRIAVTGTPTADGALRATAVYILAPSPPQPAGEPNTGPR